MITNSVIKCLKWSQICSIYIISTNKQYTRGAILFCSRAQIWILFITAGRNFFKLLMLFMKFLRSRKFFGPFFGPFFAHFLWLLREKLDIFKYLNISLIFEMFLSNDKKVQGPQKQARGPHAARGSHFGHACNIP